MSSRRVVVTGMGLVTPLGHDVPSTWAGMIAGRSGVSTIDVFDPSRLSVRFAGQVRGFDPSAVIDRKDDLLHHDAGLDAAEPAAAEILRHQQAGKSHFGKGLPEIAGKSDSVLAVAQLTQMRHRRLVADKTARAVAQHGLFFGKDEGHGRVPV